MVYRMISSRQVMAKVFADLDIKEGSNRQSDILEWIGEAIEKIGAVRQLKRIVSGVDGSPLIEIKNNQAKLPSDLFRLNSVLYSPTGLEPFFKMRIATGSINAWSSSSVSNSNGDVLVRNEDLIEIVKILYAKYVEDPVYSWFSKMDYNTALEILNTNQNVKILLSNLVNRHNQEKNIDSYDLKYSIKPGYINTNIGSGYLKLVYDAVPVDEDGFPLIPDNISYVEAVYWHVVMKLKYPEYLSGKIDRERYYDIRRSWNFYCKQAYGDAMMPNMDEMESIKNQWNRLVPELNSHSNYYNDTDEPQIIYNKN